MSALPFTQEQFLSVFVGYNEAIWPSQIVAYLLGFAAVTALVRPSPISDRLITGVLATMWLWTGIVYQALFFSEINKAAFGFGVLFILQGALITYVGLVRHQLRFGFASGITGFVGIAFLAYSVLLYPLIGWLSGHGYPAMPMFGVTPCPVVIFTLGFLLLSIGNFRLWLLVIPVVWSLIGGSAAIFLDVPQDWLLLVSGLIALALLTRNRRSFSASPRSIRH